MRRLPGAADTARAILAKIKSGQLGREFSSRDVWRPQWSRLTDRDAVQAGLDMLVDYGWLMARKVYTGGRPSFIYSVTAGAAAALKPGAEKC